jgi:hypothetical protein
MKIELIKKLSLSESKNIFERLAKLCEESGELAQEILIANKASGFSHKKAGADGIGGEAVDVLLVALSIFFKNGHSIADLYAMIDKKCKAWEDGQRLHKN